MKKNRTAVKTELVLLEFTVGVLLEVQDGTDTDVILKRGAEIANDLFGEDLDRRLTPDDVTHIERNPEYLDKNF